MPQEYKPAGNDNLTPAMELMNLVADKYKGKDDFLDIVTWNVRYFHDKDPERVDRIVNVLDALNADIIVLQEILDGSLEVVADKLTERGAGHYKTAYGTTGGNQRVAMMYDLDYVRAKDDIVELYQKGQVRADDEKDAFPRLPLLGIFTCFSSDDDQDPFDFQLIGVHLKSQRGGGGPQRRKAAEYLGRWLEEVAPLVDADVIIIGDWNERPGSSSWTHFHDLQDEGKALFSAINDESRISHLMYKNKKSIGSRLDLGAVSIAAAGEMKSPPQPVVWGSLIDLLEANPKAKEIKAYIKEIREKVSDHMPVVTRFYITEQE